LIRELSTSDETSHLFRLPSLLQVPGGDLAERIASWQLRVSDTDRQHAENESEIDDIAFRLYGIDGEDRGAMEEVSSTNIEAVAEKDTDNEELGEDTGPTIGCKPLTATLLSYATGCLVGRWDVRCATNERPMPKLPDPFDPLPVCSPGMLQGECQATLILTPL
jgi:hypothetical protein